MIADQVAHMEKQIVAKEVTTFVEDSFHEIMHCLYATSRTGVCSVIYIVVEQLICDLQPREVMHEVFDKHIAKYFGTSDAADKISLKLLFTNMFMGSIAMFIQWRTRKAPAAELFAT